MEELRALLFQVCARGSRFRAPVGLGFRVYGLGAGTGRVPF